MKLILEPTDRMETFESAPCRVWKGVTDSDMMLVSVEELDAIVLGAIRIFLKHVAGETP